MPAYGAYDVAKEALSRCGKASFVVSNGLFRSAEQAFLQERKNRTVFLPGFYGVVIMTMWLSFDSRNVSLVGFRKLAVKYCPRFLVSAPVRSAVRLCRVMSACIAGRRHAFFSRMTNGKRPELIVFCSGRIG